MPAGDDVDLDGNARIYTIELDDGETLRLSAEEARAMIELGQLTEDQLGDEQNRE